MTADAAPAATQIGNDGALGRRIDWPRLIRGVGYLAVFLSLATAIATFFILMGLTPIQPTPRTVAVAKFANGGLVSLLLLLVVWELGSLVLANRKGQAAAQLHIRIVLLFSIVAAAPAILLAISASFSLDRGLDNWFSTRTQAIVNNSLSIAQAYAEQQATQLRIDTLSVKHELERSPSLMTDDPSRFKDFLAGLAQDRNLAGIFLINDQGAPMGEVTATNTTRRDYPPPVQGAIDEAKAKPTEVVLISPGNSNVVGAITALEGFNNLFVYAARPLDPRIAGYLAMTAANVAEYRTLSATRLGVQIAFGILFLGITVVTLLSAIWLGIGFANKLVAPIRRLIDAAKEVSAGNLRASVQPSNSDGDVGALGVTFNTMTAQLRNQRQQLVAASELNDSRRRFIEAVLSGVTAGVIGIDARGHVTIANRTALQTLGIAEKVVEAPIAEIAPELASVVARALSDGRPEHRDQIVVSRGGRDRTINIRVTTERATGQAHGYVITLDDITDLVSAQRSSAWADIARRIAHEIKNPLTPIQLSAERLKRKFGRVIVDDREVFDQCTDTIIRQVGDIGRMVDEFSAFARMPKPSFVVGDLSDTIRESVFLISVAQPEIAFETRLPEAPMIGRFDARLLGQAIANIIKNATEAIVAYPAEPGFRGTIEVIGRLDGNSIVVDVVDNGIGLPKENRQRLLEPYVTTREKGTGLGLAIVTKIIEEHGGRVDLLDAPAVAAGGHGAMIHITLPRVEAAASAAAAGAAGG